MLFQTAHNNIFLDKVDEFWMDIVQCPPDAQAFLNRWRSIRHDLGEKRQEKLQRWLNLQAQNMFFVRNAPQLLDTATRTRSAYAYKKRRAY